MRVEIYQQIREELERALPAEPRKRPAAAGKPRVALVEGPGASGDRKHALEPSLKVSVERRKPRFRCLLAAC